MREVGIREAKATLSALLKAGEAVVITRHGRPVARLVPIEPEGRPRFGMAREAFERSGLTREDIDRALAPISDEELKEWRLV